MKASISDQRSIIDLQNFDFLTANLKNKAANLPELAEINSLSIKQNNARDLRGFCRLFQRQNPLSHLDHGFFMRRFGGLIKLSHGHWYCLSHDEILPEGMKRSKEKGNLSL